MNSIDTTTRTTRVCMHIMDVRAVVYSSYVLGIVRVVRVIIILLIISSLIRARNDINNTIMHPPGLSGRNHRELAKAAGSRGWPNTQHNRMHTRTTY